MANILRPHPDATLGETLEAMPERATRFLAASFQALAKLDFSKRQYVFDEVVTVGLNTEPNANGLGAKLQIDEERAALIFNAASYLAALTASFEELTTNALTDGLLKHKIIDRTIVSAISKWVEIFQTSSKQIKAEYESEAVANEILPSLYRFDFAVDVRLSRSATGPAAVPVAIAMLDTDVSNQTIWFQMSKAQLTKLRNQLNSAIELFEKAEKLAKSA